MLKRTLWLNRIEKAWRKKSILWLSGVRRAGKTTLCQSVPGAKYYDCELPSVRNLVEDPEGFLKGHKGERLILDEIHRLQNPSEILKIAADHFSDIFIIATGSSTLGASKKFKDTLTGRKTNLWLTPMALQDTKDFGNSILSHRLFAGGLPPFFLAESLDRKEFQNWVDDYWAKDIQELFRLERRHAFQKFFELLMAQSGGIFEASRFSVPCEISRPTVQSYLSVLEATFVVHVVRPMHSRKAVEIISSPKVYGFDTGFICFFRGIDQLRDEDRGFLWEHIVLNEFYALQQHRNIYYWRDKRGHEIDFILQSDPKKPTAIECKWKSKKFDPTCLEIFRNHYPNGLNYCLSSDINEPYSREFKKLKVEFIGLEHLGGVV